MDDSELIHLFHDMESDRVERKASPSDPDRLCEAICAFANDLPNHRQAGVLFIGVHDNGRCANLAVNDELLLKLADLRSNGNILPFPSMTVQKKTFDGCDLAVVVVEPSDDPPVRFRGRTWVRVGPRRAIATPEEERRLTEKRRSRNVPFDIQPVMSASLDDLDLEYFKQSYLPVALAKEACMSRPVVAFFNSQSGVGKTTLVYHLAWMYADLGLRVLAVDLDPQANLTMALLNEARLESLWNQNGHAYTIYGSVESRISHPGTETGASPHLEYIGEDQLSFSIGPTGLALLPGDLSLALLEGTLSEAWFQCSGSNNAACRLLSAFWQIIQRASEVHQADIVLIDTGSSLGSINRAALIAADYVALPLSEDLLTLQGLHDSGATLRNWKAEWQSRLTNDSVSELPPARMHPLGYIFIRPLIRLDRPVVGDKDFATRLPATYREHVDGIHDTTTRNITNDPVCLAVLKNYQALMPLAQEAHKPIFLLKPADGAIGSLLQAVQSAYGDFRNLAEKIAERTQVSLSRPS